MRTFFPARSLVIASAALLLVGAWRPGMASAQSSDPRWQPWLGCWVANDAPVIGAGSGGLVCVVPASRGEGVDIATISNGKVVHRERVNPTGVRTSKSMDNCPGWESATWSKDNRRVLLRSEFVCGAGTAVKGSGVFAISPAGEWIQVQGNTVNANSSARVVRYRSAGLTLVTGPKGEVNDSLTVLTTPDPAGFSTRAVRMAAGETVQPEDVLDVAQHVDESVTAAWLNELEQGFRLNARQLVGLADGGMPPHLIDLMVALAYPQRFAVERRADIRADVGAQGSSGYSLGSGYGRASSSLYGTRWDCGYGNRMLAYGYYGDSCYPGYYGLSNFGYGYGYGSGYGYGNSGYNGGYYWGQQPVVIIQRVPDTPSQSHGYAINGRGYTRGSNVPVSIGATQSERTSSGSAGSGGSTGSAGSSSGTSSGTTSGTSSGTSTGRTAQPRVPPG